MVTTVIGYQYFVITGNNPQCQINGCILLHSILILISLSWKCHIRQTSGLDKQNSGAQNIPFKAAVL